MGRCSCIVFWCAFVLLSADTTLAQEQKNPGATEGVATQFFAAKNIKRFSSEPQIGPDAMNLRYEVAGRAIAAAGGEIVLVGVSGAAGQIGLAFGGLLELSNEGVGVPVPYHFLRAVLGVRLVATTRWFTSGENRYRVYGTLNFTHESDHFSGKSWTREMYMSDFDEDNFSSFEHLKLGVALHYDVRENWFVRVGTALRGFTPPINRFAGRRQQVGVEFEGSVRFRLAKRVSVYSAFFWEGIANCTNRDLLPDAFRQTLRFELGLAVMKYEGSPRFDLYIGLQAMDGRGLDFANHYSPSLLLGLRGSP